jgi:hypothetical protein
MTPGKRGREGEKKEHLSSGWSLLTEKLNLDISQGGVERQCHVRAMSLLCPSASHKS